MRKAPLKGYDFASRTAEEMRAREVRAIERRMDAREAKPDASEDDDYSWASNPNYLER